MESNHFHQSNDKQVQKMREYVHRQSRKNFDISTQKNVANKFKTIMNRIRIPASEIQRSNIKG